MASSPPGRCEEGEFSDEDVSDLPLPAWMEGDSLAPPCQVCAAESELCSNSRKLSPCAPFPCWENFVFHETTTAVVLR